LRKHSSLHRPRSPRTAHGLGWLTLQPLASQAPCWEHPPSLQALMSCLCQQGAPLYLPGHPAGLTAGLRPQAGRQAGLKGALQHLAWGHLLRDQPLACCWWYLRGVRDRKEFSSYLVTSCSITGPGSPRSRHGCVAAHALYYTSIGRRSAAVVK
jgi:hypothetical protein